MLEKLSSILKRTTDKIANAVFLDKKLVDSIIKDLQRGLIEADVNVQLVLELTKKIKKVALDERIKGIEKKEHIIKILHDELLTILGEKREIKLHSKTNIFMMLGLYGAGKCVHADTKIQLADGNIKEIDKIYEKYSSINNQEKLDDGFIIDVTNQNLFAPSFNSKTLKIENKKITHMWKLNKEYLYEISLNNGNDFSIKVTPEHPFFILRNSQVIQVRADELKESDFIATPNSIDTKGKTINMEEKLKRLNLDIFLQKGEIEKIIKNKHKTLKEINCYLKNKRNYCQFTTDLKNNKVPIELVDNLPNNLLIKSKSAGKIIAFPRYLTSELSEFLGYLMGDGSINSKYVQFSNEDPEIINRIRELSKILFNLEPKINLDKRTKKMYDLRIISTTLVGLLSMFGLNPGKKGKTLMIPEEIMLSDDETIRQFIKAYFDCDSSPANNRYIELTSESKILIQQFNMILKRFGIISTISKKLVNSIPYYRLAIKARYAEKYAEKIGYLISRKEKRVKNYRNMGIIQGCGNQDMIPLGKFLKETRQLLGFSIGEIQSNAVYSYGIYEERGLISKEKLKQLVTYYLLKKKGIYLQLLKDIGSNININKKYGNAFANGVKKYLEDTGITETKENLSQLSYTGQHYLQKIIEADTDSIISTLAYFANSNVSWLPVKTIHKIKNNHEYVYDLTVEDNHSFIAEGFIVHNTTTISKLALYYSKRGNKVCAVGLDIHRPAASEQLKQLCDKLNIPAFIDPNEKKDPIKIWKKYKKEIAKYNLVFIDTAGRDALDKDLIKEIKAIAKAIKPTETFLVMPADIGQTAKTQAQAFKEAVNITGVIITRMDSTAKAGGALTACYEAKVPVVFLGTGEKAHDLEIFNPEAFLSRLLGMGDLQSLIEKIKSVTDEKTLEKQQKRLEEGKLTIDDVISQVSAMGEMGSMDKILDMIPGLGKAKDKIPKQQLEQQQEKLKKWEHIAKSMTPEEKENPELLEKQTSRIQRIAKGSGTSTTDVRTLIKQYRMLQEMVKSQSTMMDGKMDQKTMMKLARKFGKKKMFKL